MMIRIIHRTGPIEGRNAEPEAVEASLETRSRSSAPVTGAVHAAAGTDRYGALRMACEDTLATEADECWPDTVAPSPPSGIERSPDDPAILVGLAIALSKHGLALPLPPALLERLIRHAAAGDLACQALLARQQRLDAQRSSAPSVQPGSRTATRIETVEIGRAVE